MGGGADVDPLEAAMAGLAGEPGANVSVNLDGISVDLGQLGAPGAALYGLGGWEVSTMQISVLISSPRPVSNPQRRPNRWKEKLQKDLWLV